MYCSACGAEIPDTAKFCLQCGHQAQEQTSGQWEVAVISYVSGYGFWQTRLVAKVVTPRGTFLIRDPQNRSPDEVSERAARASVCESMIEAGSPGSRSRTPRGRLAAGRNE